MNGTSNKKQKCSHSDFNTIGDDVFCNDCGKSLGYFDPVKLCGFVKTTKDTIEDKYLNEKEVKLRLQKAKVIKISVWLAVDKDGRESLFVNCPERVFSVWDIDNTNQFVDVPSGTIEKLIGRKLTWEDEPVEYEG